MKRVDNYAIQTQSAKERFLGYDQTALIQKFQLPHDEIYFYPVMLGSTYRLDRKTGNLQRQQGDTWVDANTHGEVLTLLDLLCDSRNDRFIAGRWKSMTAFGMQFHQNLMEDRPDRLTLAIDKDPDLLHRRCAALGGTPGTGGDISYRLEFFDGLPICIQFWHSDEEFPPRMRFLWDENANMYLKYETMWYAIGILKQRLAEG